jgi:hypothetical protein
MFKSRTVFVVGAGASDEVGLPIGKVLTSEIAKLVNLHVEFDRPTKGDWQIYEMLRREVQANPDAWVGNKLLVSARHVAEAMEMATSIDTFLESFGHDKERQLIGKLGIAKAIITAERKSKLATRETYKPFNIRDVLDTWYVRLAQLLFSGVPATTPHVAFENVSFIVFNYDRCLQAFLARALQVYFQISEGAAHDIVRNVRFFHPYGNLGGMFPGDSPHLPFGADDYDLRQLAESINTFSESATDDEILRAVRDEIREAETLVFLGFGFHDQNMEILSLPAPPITHPAAVRVLATTYGMSNSDAEIVRNLIGNMLSGEPLSTRTPYTVSTFDGKCSTFFAEYWRSLTAS